MLTLSCDQAVSPMDGMVAPKDLDVARENCRPFKDIFFGLGKGDGEWERVSQFISVSRVIKSLDWDFTWQPPR
ncbi:phosphotransferase enzyme family protein [Penicillium paradoxum]|uniref:phosphotransferase enzyme family protein n=1 Tax=Penicillium paradoxum TaxID=176176 RepID=UPI0025485E64|nr:phosphotransferase enzyme family protein [Penicillium paradoxum]KAJ5779797.1 phosphotransferase enzyme family protein [Penicillium paradoxum]